MNELIIKINAIKALVAEGDFELALNDLKILLSEVNFIRAEKLSQIEKEFLLISANYSNDKKARINNTIEPELFIRNHAKSIFSILYLLDTITNLSNKSIKSHNSISSNDINFKFWNVNIIDSESPFARNYLSIYQSFPVIPTPNKSDQLLENIFKTIVSKKNDEYHIWIDRGDEDNFGKIYTNTSVLYFLIQYGVPLSDSICTHAILFIDSINEISIDNRAKWYFDIQTNRISKNNTIKFLNLLSSLQFDISSPYFGAFKPFLQGSRGTIDMPNKLPTHYGGFVFHACLIADVLLHINTENQSIKDTAISILKKIRIFIEKIADTNNGYLIDASFEKSSQFTSWFFALTSGLKIDLPEQWQEIILEILNRKEDSMFKSAFLAMNLSLILMRRRYKMSDITINAIYAFFDLYFEELKRHLDNNREISNRDLSLYGRSIIYINKALGNIPKKFIAENFR